MLYIIAKVKKELCSKTWFKNTGVQTEKEQQGIVHGKGIFCSLFKNGKDISPHYYLKNKTTDVMTVDSLAHLGRSNLS